jgi:CBS-domain-containing membrane protein
VALTIAGSQTDFPVVAEGQVVGVLTQANLLAGLRSHGEESAVAAIMQRSFATVDADEMLESAFRKLSHCQCHTLPVLADSRLIGLLTMSNVGEYVRIQTALASKEPYSSLPN